MNLRTIKKDIEYLVGNVIDDCNLYMSLFPNKESQEAAGKIMDEAIELYNNLIDKVNNPDKSDPKKIKEHYRFFSSILYYCLLSGNTLRFK